MKSAYEIILAPLMTEKMTMLTERENLRASRLNERAKESKKKGEQVQPRLTVAFRVDRDANKIEIGRAVEEIWKVRVASVRTINCEGKLKRLGRFAGRRANWKKAIVTLAEGQTIPEFTA